MKVEFPGFYYNFMQSKQSYPTIKDFVIQQAHEKAFQRLVMGLKEFEKEKTKIVKQKSETLQREFEMKKKENTAQRRINKSSKINESRMKKMNIRQTNLQELVLNAELKLAKEICKDQKKYKSFLKNLIVEGLIRLLEPIVLVRSLQKDKKFIRQLIPQCKREFKELIKKQGIDQSIGDVDLRLDQKYTLAQKNIDKNKARLKKSQEAEICFGGVIMTNEDGLIVCKNTIDTRLELAYQHLLPNIRKTLYSE